MEDPFASAPADEAQADEPRTLFDEPPAVDPPAKSKGIEVAVKPKLEALVDSGKVVLTFKGGTGFDAPWIVIHAADLQDAYDQITGDNASLLAEVMARSQKAGQHFASQSPSAAPRGGGQGGNTGQPPNVPQQAQEAPGGEERFCRHGKMNFRSGVSKAGKPYSAFFCSSRDRNDECKAQFLR